MVFDIFHSVVTGSSNEKLSMISFELSPFADEVKTVMIAIALMKIIAPKQIFFQKNSYLLISFFPPTFSNKLN